MFSFVRRSTKRVEPVSLTAEDVDRLLGSLCAFPKDGLLEGKGTRISEQNIVDIRHYLGWLDSHAGRTGAALWRFRPRTYAILRVIGKVSLMDEFIRLGLNDKYLPWKERTLPETLFNSEADYEVKQAFLNVQYFYLTEFDVKSIETGEKHQNLGVSGSVYFTPIKSLGQGGFGGVDEVYSNLSLKRYARKRVSRGRHNDHNRRTQEALVRELENLRILSKHKHHRHLVRIIGSYTDPEFIAYLMEPIADGNLEQFLGLKMNDANRSKLRHFYGCLAGAIHHLHRNKIRHRDLTARNILVYNNEVYLSDFGAAYSWAHLSAGNTRHLNPPVSKDYMAPEISRMEERGEPSDMWSLGVIFLEMTTRLLGRQLSDLRQHIRRHSVENKYPPFYFANIPAVMEWLKRLSADEENSHDNEPISWARGLVHPRPEDRPSAWELMKDILESPSFTIFCCFKCHGDYQDEAFAYDASMPRDTRDTREGDADATMTEVAELFSNDTSGQHLRVLPAAKARSIDKWLSSSSADVEERSINETWPPPYGFNHIPEEPEDTDTQEELLKMQETMHQGFQNDFYMPWTYSYDNIQMGGRLEQDSWSPSVSKPQGNQINWEDQEAQGMSEHTPPPTEDAEYQNLQDSNLGFMEYDDESSRPYDEISDRSDNSSEILQEEDDSGLAIIRELEKDNNSPESDPEIPNTDAPADQIIVTEESQVLFEEESDESEVDVPETISRRATVEDDKTTEEVARQDDCMTILRDPTIIQQDVEGVTADEPIISLEEPNELLQPSSMEIREISKDGNKTGSIIETNISAFHGEIPLINDRADQNYLVNGDSIAQEGKRHDDALASVKATPDIPEATNYSSIPSIIVPLVTIIDTESPGLTASVEHPDSTVPETTQTISEEIKGSEPDQKTTQGKQSRVRKPKEVKFQLQSPEDTEEQKAASGQPAEIPKIEIQLADDVRSEPSLLSKANLNELNKARAPRSPKKRAALLGVDPAKLLHDFCDMASSAPSSQLTVGTKKKLDTLIFMSVPRAEVEKTFVKACQNGRNSVVKYMLSDERLARLSKGKRRIALIRAVQGASRRHNKCVRTLIEAGVDANEASSKTGKTPLHIAIEHTDFYGYTNLIWLLADPSSGHADVNLPDLNGDYPLTKLFSGSDSAPLEQHRLGALAILLQANVDTNVVLPGSKNTPLHLAVRRQDHRAVAMLLHKGADVNAKSAAGTTPLQMTANQFRGEMGPNHAEVLDLLLRYRARVDEKSGALGRAALHWAVSSGTARAVEVLLKYKASPGLKDKDGLDAMALAVKNAGKLTSNKFLSEDDRLSDHIDIMQRLNDSAGCKFPMEEGKCPVEIAIKDGNVTLLKKLMKYHLDPQAPFFGGTVQDYAIKHGNAEVLGILESH